MRSGKARTAAALDPHYVNAFAEIVRRIERSLRGNVAAHMLPIAMYVAGGAAEFFYTGARVSEDIDAAFSRRILLPDDLEVSYAGGDGLPRILYFDRQYNETFALMHENTHADSARLRLTGVDAGVVDVRLFAPVDLAVSKIARFAEHDQTDIRALARAGLVGSAALRRRANEALGGYVGNLDRVKTSIELACGIVAEEEGRRTGRK